MHLNVFSKILSRCNLRFDLVCSNVKVQRQLDSFTLYLCVMTMPLHLKQKKLNNCLWHVKGDNVDMSR